MRTSARNQFFGRVSRLQTGAVDDEVELELPGGQRLVAIISRGSAGTLALEVGSEAFALVDAGAVMLARDGGDGGDARPPARNRWPGRVLRVVPGAVSDEVSIRLHGPGESVLVAMVARERSQALELDAAVEAVFQASSVIVGVLS